VEASYITAIAKVNQTLPCANRIEKLTYLITESKDTFISINIEPALSFFFKQIPNLNKIEELRNRYTNILSQTTSNPIEIIDKENKSSIVDQFLEECCNVFDKEDCWPNGHWVFSVLFYVHSNDKLKLFLKSRGYTEHMIIGFQNGKNILEKNDYNELKAKYDTLTNEQVTLNKKYTDKKTKYKSLLREFNNLNDENLKNIASYKYIISLSWFVTVGLLIYTGYIHYKSLHF
jgi:hypothetical protein